TMLVGRIRRGKVMLRQTLRAIMLPRCRSTAGLRNDVSFRIGAIMGSALSSRREFLASVVSALALPSLSASAQSVSEETTVPFSFRASDAALTDLKRRLDQARLPEHETGVGWEQGPPLAALRDLVDYWRSGYDWRKCETEISGWPQFRTK